MKHLCMHETSVHAATIACMHKACGLIATAQCFEQLDLQLAKSEQLQHHIMVW